MAENGAWLGVPAEHEVEVGPADPALGHLDEQLPRPRLGDGHALDGDVTIPDIDGRRHEISWHGDHATAERAPTGIELRVTGRRLSFPRSGPCGPRRSARSGTRRCRTGTEVQVHRGSWAQDRTGDRLLSLDDERPLGNRPTGAVDGCQGELLGIEPG